MAGGSDPWAVALPDQPQSGERQQVVDLVDQFAVGRDDRRMPAGCDGRRLLAELLADAPEDAVHLAGEAVHEARLERGVGRAPDRGLRRLEVDLEQPRRALGRRLFAALAAVDPDVVAIPGWSQPGALTGGLNYYRASPLYPPTADDPGPKKLQLKPEDFRVRVPTLVVWGERDTALLPGCLEGLDRVVPDLKLVRVPEASHWIARERTDLVIREIEAFTIGR